MGAYKNFSADLAEEAKAFDRQIIERVENGHIPDIRNCGRNEWFYSNIWRDQVYVGLMFGKIADQIEMAIHHLKPHRRRVRVLEIACGPGHMSLEMARRGYDVTGLDVSSACIDIARATAERSIPAVSGFLVYHNTDFATFVAEAPYDVVYFSCAFHHFADIEGTLQSVKALMKSDGIFFASEPTRLALKPMELLIIHLLRGALAAGNHYHGTAGFPADAAELAAVLKTIQSEFDYIDEKGANVQSPHDNEAGYEKMYPVMKRMFNEIETGFDFCFFDRIIGALRLDTVSREHEIATWLAMVDRALCREGFTPEQFHFVGRNSLIRETV